MNKSDIIKKLDKLKLAKNGFWVLAFASLVLRNLLNIANDIDIAVTED